MICAHCSTPVPDEARFCHSCGSLVSDAEGQAAATAAMDQSSFLHMERLLREDTKGVYTVKHMLGRGGMAVVYLAEETGLARKVALKVLPPELTFGHGVERFKREARTAAALDHPNIIPIYRIGDSGKLFWYAMKFLEGKSLEDLLRERGALSLDETVDILMQVADALDYAHEHKVIHRDIKPANVMLDNRNRVIVTDFGIAKALTEGKLTATDSVIGTPYFMSPEQGMGKPVSGKADQYSVAVMAYRMLAGHVPFDGDSAIDILHKHCMFEAPSLHEDNPDVPDHVSAAVARALAKSADERFATVHEFVMAMKDPHFAPRAIARPSVATVVMDPAEARRMRGPGTSPSGANSGKGRTVPPRTAAGGGGADKTVIADAQGRVATRGATAPAPRSKAGLFATIGLVVAVGAGVGYWQLTKAPTGAGGAPTTSAAPTASPAPGANLPAGAATGTPGGTPATGTPDSTGVGPTGTGTPTSSVGSSAAPPESKVATPETKAPAGETKTPTKSAATPRPRPTAPQTQTASNPPATQQAAPANPPAAAPAPAAAAAATGTLQLILTTPGIVSIDGKEIGERARYQTTLAPGTHVISVRKDGFVTLTQTVEIKAGETTPLRLTLEPRP